MLKNSSAKLFWWDQFFVAQGKNAHLKLECIESKNHMRKKRTQPKQYNKQTYKQQHKA